MNDHITSHSDAFNEQFHHKKKKRKCFKIHLTFSSFHFECIYPTQQWYTKKKTKKTKQENHKNKYAFL